MWTERSSGFDLDIDPLRLAITDQRYRGGGWVWHVSADGVNGGDTLEQRGGFETADDAKRAVYAWVRTFCESALAAVAKAEAARRLTDVVPPPPFSRTSNGGVR